MSGIPEFSFLISPFKTAASEISSQTDWLLFFEGGKTAIFDVFVTESKEPLNQMLSAIEGNGNTVPIHSMFEDMDGNRYILVLLKHFSGISETNEVVEIAKLAAEWVSTAYEAEDSGVYDPSEFDDDDFEDSEFEGH